FGSKSLSWTAPGGEGVAGALVEGTLLALYRYDRFKSSNDDEDGGDGVESLEVTSSETDQSGAVEEARVRAEAQNAARDLQNAPSNLLRPTDMADRAQELADAH